MMKAGYGLELVQTQRLSLTPEMRQAIAVLQMNAMELREFIVSQAEENPLIDLVEDDASEEGILSYFLGSSISGPDLSRSAEPAKLWPFEALASDLGISLRDHLYSQLGVLPLSAGEISAAEAVIGSIDDNGYFRSTADEVAALCGQSVETVESMLATVKSFDPPGVGASDLKECLSIQARARGASDLVLRLIEAHLEDLAAARYKKIAKEERVSLSKVLAGRDAVLRLDPKPGSGFSDAAVAYIVPEISVRKVGGEIRVDLNDRAVPKLRWNPFYRDLAKMGEREAKAYLAREIKKAQALFRCIEQRQSTIVKVMTAVAAKQEAFFDSGPGHLEPLTLKDISQEIGVHESTVSRAIANKHVDTAYGVFPCRAFFSPGVKAGGGVHSQDAVKASIVEIVRSEDRRNPLGDQEISRELKKRGMTVARRTVTKYRAELGIMAQGKRKTL